MSAETPHQRPSLKDILVAYGNRMLVQEQEKVDREYLGLDENLLQQDLASTDTASQYENLKWDDCIDNPDVPAVRKKPLFVKLLKGEPDPISLVVIKTMFREGGKDHSCFMSWVCRGNLEGRDDKTVIGSFDDRKHIMADFRLEISPDGIFEIMHRFTRENFRGPQNESKEGLGDILLASCEQIAKSYANRNNKQKTVLCNAGQLDVMLWMEKNGYRAWNSRMQEELDKIYSASNPDLRIIDGLYVFHKDKIPKPAELYEKRHDAERVTFFKKIQPDSLAQSVRPDSGLEERVQRKTDEVQIAEIREGLGL